MKALVAGWFSFESMGATAGDLLAKGLVCRWLDGHSCPYDVALASPFTGGVDWRVVEPSVYSHVIFVCGPFGNGWPVTEFLPRFACARLVGVNLSMLEPLETWNPFELLLERDSSATARPDIAFLAVPEPVPVVGVVLVHEQAEYKQRMHSQANGAIQKLIASRPMATIPIDTRLDVNSTGLRTPAEVESLISRTDVVITTRLHGMVLAIKNSVPVLAIDPIPGGAKIRKQAESIGWPVVFTADDLDRKRLEGAFDYCLTEAARVAAGECRAEAVRKLANLEASFLKAFSGKQSARIG
jgi:hypothetical protein